MSSQVFGRGSPGRSGEVTSDGRGSGTGGTASDAVAKLSNVAQQAAAQAKQSASNAASTVTHQVKDLLNNQVGSGADLVGHFASSAKRAAEDLDRNAPQLAGVMRGVADRIENFADDMRDQSVDDLLRTASDFTRRQPALVFGLAALGGFFVFRTLKASSSETSMSSQPAAAPRYQGASQYHGV
jgi:uncharacterized phage infection (PIP) family protein YhgE